MRLAFLFLFLSCCAHAQNDTVIRFYFDFNQADLKTMKNVFLKLDTKRWLPEVTLTGKADTSGNAAYNEWLSEQRLLAVEDLIGKQSYFKIAGRKSLGESAPAAKYNAVKERCVEVRLTRMQTGKPDQSAKNTEKSVSNEALKLPVNSGTKVIPRAFDPNDSLIATGDVLVLNNIEFELNEVIVTLESYPELQHLVSMMKKNPTMRIHIRGHVCCAPASELSNNRAKKIYYYLINQGINDERMTFKGYSNREPHPLYQSDLFDPHHRRVEIEILSK
jgi:outer membrane protein OmpA-like peptidoglycan-associated protein